MSEGICPVCNGTKQMPCPDSHRKYGQRYGWFNYRHKDDTIKCLNCGGQKMLSAPTGMVRLREDGTPCKHEYTSRDTGRCYTIYTCIHCGDRYDIDSSD